MWGSYMLSPEKSLIRALEETQNGFIRKLMKSVHGYDYTKVPQGSMRNQILSLRTLKSRRRRFVVLMVYKILVVWSLWISIGSSLLVAQLLVVAIPRILYLDLIAGIKASSSATVLVSSSTESSSEGQYLNHSHNSKG